MNRRSFAMLAVAALNGGQLLLSAMAPQPALSAEDELTVRAHRTAEWFRDAKFGITAQWTPQSVPEDGDWYARNMYIQGSPQYLHHLEHYGHPSQVGYKDICHQWDGSEWNPEELVALYRQAGAKYLVAMANHHDGFDCWDSKHQPWNSVNLGPKTDIVGRWQRAANGAGLRFGLEVFCTQNWEWFQVSHGSDAAGPLRAVPYDGTLTAEQGRGRWWQGLDPQALYGRLHAPGAPPDAAYCANFELRVRDLLEQYHPDLIFYTDRGLPLGDVGWRLTAEQFRQSRRIHHGSGEAVVCTKHVPAPLLGSLVCDRLPDDALAPEPWQMDICIGDWFYKRGIGYKTAADVLPYLVDIVSKNGNLLLNIPIRARGSIDDRERALLRELGAWFSLHGEAIYATRPWLRFGEGPTRTQNVDFPYRTIRYTAQDVRFTRKGNALYAFLLAWPADRVAVIQSLGSDVAGAPHTIRSVSLLGCAAAVEWKRQSNTLTIHLPERPPSPYPTALRLEIA